MSYLVMDFSASATAFRFNSLSEGQLKFFKDRAADSGDVYVYKIDVSEQFEIMDEIDETSVDNVDFNDNFGVEYAEWLEENDEYIENNIEDLPTEPDDDFNDMER
jgi:hypothetical protein